ncbi:transcriptional regulator PacG/VIB-1 [Aspergillus campestris IBT 28561]|uniref:Transcriptional regulator PacG/VIB-1 n=1 Tax=Aspergillus campestris (strain IBT 28561) TaxID=1392248 RepID=A0A2I1DAM6_ASPC2|nr:transcriptional regulator PacG/VIB-1 [Aspergillus campestris IBT 28561]PKY06926.1 transcriptional regulator PacG/VIB-1 [Aspergillus campestris IBT 28561]
MEGFDTMALPYLASPLSLSNIQGTDYLNSMPGMDLPDQRSNFDSDTFVSGDDIPFPQHGLPATLDRFPSSYEDPFDVMTPFDPTPPEQPPDSSIDRNNKLLGFSVPVYNFTFLDYSLRRTSLSIDAQLTGMFFLAESPWTTSPNDNAPPQQGAELTCYRRNLFQISGTVTLPRGLRYIMTEQGDRIPILAQELTVSATESVEGNSVKIISVPWKTPVANGNPSAEDGSNPRAANTGANPKVEKEPPPIPLDIMAGQNMESDYAEFSIGWKRLQFRVATANNGRRKELQQHFVVRLKVVATLSTGAKIPICEVRSGPIIVRGRSPRNFQSRKDLPLSGSAAASRKNVQAAQTAAVNRAAPRNDSISRANPTAAKSKAPAKSTSPETASSQAAVAPQLPSPGWTQQVQHPGGSAPIPSGVLSHSSMYSQPTPEFSRQTDNLQDTNTVAAPINLTLLDEEDASNPIALRDPTRSRYPNEPPRKNPADVDSSAPPTKMRKVSHSTSQVQPRETTSSLPLLDTTNMQQPFASSLPFPNESADILYEYFPLGLDDWQAPVDAVYRPHVVHHTNMPDMKFVAARGRSKRYFAAEDVF